MARDSAVRLDVRLMPDPVVLKALTVIVRDYHRMLKRMSVGRVYERRDLLNSNIGDLGAFLARSGATNPAPDRNGRIGTDCAWVRGQRSRLHITLDNQSIFFGGFGGIPGFAASDVYAVIVGPGGGDVTVLTNWYIEYLARTGRRLSLDEGVRGPVLRDVCR